MIARLKKLEVNLDEYTDHPDTQSNDRTRKKKLENNMKSSFGDFGREDGQTTNHH